VVLYEQMPPAEAEALLNQSMREFESVGASLIWGTQKQVTELVERP